MNLVSIDLEYGALRLYVVTPGSRPKMVYRNDIPSYDRRMGWDKNAIEAFRANPDAFIQKHTPSGDAA